MKANRAPLPDPRTTQARYLEEKALSQRPATISNARSSTKAFIEYLDTAHPELASFRELERRHVEGWIRYLASKGYARSTVRNMILKVRGFLEWMQMEGWEEAPPEPLFRRGDLPPEDHHLPRPLAPETDRALLEELRREGGILSKSLLFMRTTALRIQELLDLTIDSLSELPGGQWSLRVPLGKLHSEREIPVDAETAALFGEIVELRGTPPPVKDERTGKPRLFLLMRREGGRYSREALRYYLNRAEKKAGLREHPSPHRLRHTRATELLRAGMALPALMKYLGHRSIGMTLRYAEVTGTDVRRAYNESLEALKTRFDFDSFRPKGPKPQGASSSRLSILEQLGQIANTLESYRRDHTSKPDENKRLQRLIERLRRLTADIDAAMSTS
jgi:site-specific recombinase XerD